MSTLDYVIDVVVESFYDFVDMCSDIKRWVITNFRSL